MSAWAVERLPADDKRRLEGKTPWPYPTVTNDYAQGRKVWREVTKADWWYFLEVLPSIYLRGGFAVSEAATHEYDHEKRTATPVYSCFVQIRERYYMRETTCERFLGDRVGLVEALSETGRL